MHRACILPTLLLALLLSGCGGEGSADAPHTGTAAAPTQEAGLSQDQLEKGIGPIRAVELAPTVDAALAGQGEAIFTTKCATCHKFDQRYVGPPLGQVLSQRTPEFIMNMMLNPDEMVKQHPEVKAMLAQYMTPMPNQNLTEDDARAVLEYLRDQQIEAADPAP